MKTAVSSVDEGGPPDYVANSKLEQSLTSNQKYSLEKKYLLRNESGELIETPSEAIYRMARTMATVELQYGAGQEDVERLTEEFYHMIDNGEFSPAGRVWTNAGTQIGGLFNCYVLPIDDSMDLDNNASIYLSLARAAVIHKNGGGTGYNFSNLRPRGFFVQSSKGIASGPVSFIGQYDKETEVINSGNRRGANMGMLNVTHPDIIDFITAKSVRRVITNFNVSVGATDKFMEAVEREEFYDLEFPEGEPFRYQDLEKIVDNIEENKIGGSDVGGLPDPASLRPESTPVIPGETRVIDSYSEEIAGRIDERGVVQLFAPYVFNRISNLAHKTGDPGVIFRDTMNKENPLPNLGPYEATNPCGEQPLHPYDACNLGSIIASTFVRVNSGGVAEINYGGLERVVRLATRFMDNVNDASRGPIPEIQETVLAHRRIGMGIMGWADMLIKMKISYDSEEARELAKKFMGFITDTARDESVRLAQQKGVFPAFSGSKYDSGRPEDRVRNVERTTIAPTGTISMVYGVSSGIEPLFAVAFQKNIRGGDTLSYINPLFEEEVKRRGLSPEKLLPLMEENHGSIQNIEEIPEDMKRIFKTAHDLSYREHVLTQAAFQERTENAVSKTINMPRDAKEEDVKNAYRLAWEMGCKGITVYVDGSKDVQVLETGHGKRKLITRKELSDLVMAQLKKPRPEEIKGRTEEIPTPFGDAYVTFNRERENGSRFPYESFIAIGRAGGDITAIAEGYGRLISMALKAGILPEYIIKQLEGIGGQTQSGLGPQKVKSLPDGIAKGIKRILELEGQKLESNQNNISGNFCPDCHGPLAMEEGCQKCLNPSCGFSLC
jgi:ribonucleoside-diphosphate reductase alpha chain